MGKETKIGLAVIGILLVAFGVVLAQRLAGSGEGPLAGEAPPATKTEAKSGDVDKHKSTTKTDNREEKHRKSMPSNKPTVVAAKPVVGKKKSASAAHDFSQWAVVEDSGATEKKEQAKADPAPAPPSPLMPSPQSTSISRYGTPATDHPSSASPWQNAPHARPPLPVGQSDPFQSRTASNPYHASDPSSNTGIPTGHQGVSANPNPYRARNYQEHNGQFPEYDRRANQPSSSYKDSRQSSRPPRPNPYSTVANRNSENRLTESHAPTPDRNDDGTYEIQPGDSYWMISEKLYGTGVFFRALAEHNREAFPEPDKLQAGETIEAPGQEELEKTYPDLCPKPEHRKIAEKRSGVLPVGLSRGRAYVVEEGDTLFDIARYELGKASRWVEIYEMNRERLGKDFDYLTPGMKLSLPEEDHASGASDNVTSRPEPVFQR